MFKRWRGQNARADAEAVPSNLQSEPEVDAVKADDRPPRDWIDDLSDEERDRVIEKVAHAVVSRGMTTPAILFLEMHKPVSFFASQSLVVISPFTAPFIGLDNVQVASKLIEKRENVELLIRRIEELSVEQDAARRKANRTSRSESGHGAGSAPSGSPTVSE